MLEGLRVLPPQDLIRSESADFSLPENPRPMCIEEFAEKYPYLLRYCRTGQVSPDRFILEPQSGEQGTFGVFFYPLRLPTEPQNGAKPTLVVRTMDLVSKIDSARQLLMKGILVVPSSLYEQVSERLFQQCITAGKGVLTAGLETQNKMYKEWPVLNEAKVDLGMEPVLTIPARMEIGREYSLV